MVGPDHGESAERDARVHFSRRQAQILELVAKGQSDKEIAGQLEVSLPTVRTHLHRFYKDNGVRNKDNGVRNRAEAVALWSRSGSRGTR